MGQHSEENMRDVLFEVEMAMVKLIVVYFLLVKQSNLIPMYKCVILPFAICLRGLV